MDFGQLDKLWAGRKSAGAFEERRRTMSNDTRSSPGNAPPSPRAIADAMTGTLAPVSDAQSPLAAVEGALAALIPSPQVQNHAPFLANLPNGDVLCLWFAGSLEGASDIAVHGAVLPQGADTFGPVTRITDDPERSEQNPLLVVGRGGALHLIHTAQPSGHQDRCAVRHRRLTVDGSAITAGEARDLPLPRGTFVRSPVHVRPDGSWLIPLFRCNPAPGEAWTGRYDTAAVGISRDEGETIDIVDVPHSVGCVHMAIVENEGDLAAFFRRRQADTVHRSRKPRRRHHMVRPDGDRPSQQQLVDFGDRACPTGASPSPPTPPTRPSTPPAAPRSTTSSAMATAARAKTQPPRGRRTPARPSGACRARRSRSASRSTAATPFRSGRWWTMAPAPASPTTPTDGANHELSYPSLVERADGGLDLAYTFHRRAIKFTRLPPAFTDGGGWRSGERRMTEIVGITMGDPAGVGPEITVKALAEMSAEDRAQHARLRQPRHARRRAGRRRHRRRPRRPRPRHRRRGRPAPLRQDLQGGGRRLVPLHRGGHPRRRARRHRLHRHRAHQQGRAQRRRPPL